MTAFAADGTRSPQEFHRRFSLRRRSFFAGLLGTAFPRCACGSQWVQAGDNHDGRQEAQYRLRNIDGVRSDDRFAGPCPAWAGVFTGFRAAESVGQRGHAPGPSDSLLSELEEIYKDIYANPELSLQEERTAGIAADWLREQGYEVTEGVGGTGVVGVLENGEGATVLLRADMDALPMEENTGLPYASTKTVTGPSGHEVPVAHSCGHDMHVTWLMGASRILAENQDAWNGTVIALLQPAEETGEGARAIEDGLIEQFPKPDVMLAQHVLPVPAGKLATRGGLFPTA